MIILEKLYDCAGKHITGDKQNWSAFCKDFRGVFGANIVMYRPDIINGIMAWRSLNQLVATSNPEYAKGYVEHKVFEQNEIADDSLNPLEPSRRSDVVANAQFKDIEIAKSFFIPRGIFYMLAVSAILPDNSNFVLVAWRSEDENDFSDIDKQRLALFMRYLATQIRVKNTKPASSIDSSIENFGKKYSLTKSEIGVLSGMLDGKSLRFLAEETDRSYGTVRWHVQNILEKCQVKSKKNLLSEFYALIKR